MEFQVIRRMLLKSRHHILLPLLSICLVEKRMKEEEIEKKAFQERKKSGQVTKEELKNM